MMKSKIFVIVCVAIMLPVVVVGQTLECSKQNQNFVNNSGFEIGQSIPSSGWPDIDNAIVCEWHRAFGIRRTVQYALIGTKAFSKTVSLISAKSAVAGIFQNNFTLQPGEYWGSIVIRNDMGGSVSASDLVVSMMRGLDINLNQDVILPNQLPDNFLIWNSGAFVLDLQEKSRKFRFTFNIDENTSSKFDQLSIYMFKNGYVSGIVYLDEVKIKSPLMVNPGENRLICLGDEIVLGGNELNPTASGGITGYLYKWYELPSMNVISHAKNPVVSPTQTTSYLLEVTDEDGFGDVVSSNVTITVNENCFCYYPIECATGDLTYLSISEDLNGSVSAFAAKTSIDPIVLSNSTVLDEAFNAYVIRLDKYGRTKWVRSINFEYPNFLSFDHGNRIINKDTDYTYITINLTGGYSLDNGYQYLPQHNNYYTVLLCISKWGVITQVYNLESSGGNVHINDLLYWSNAIFITGYNTSEFSFPDAGIIDAGTFLLKIPLNDIPPLLKTYNELIYTHSSITTTNNYLFFTSGNKLYTLNSQLTNLNLYSLEWLNLDYELWEIRAAADNVLFGISMDAGGGFVCNNSYMIMPYALNGVIPTLLNSEACSFRGYSLSCKKGNAFHTSISSDNSPTFIEKFATDNNSIVSIWKSSFLPNLISMVSVNSPDFGYYASGNVINQFNTLSGVFGCSVIKNDSLKNDNVFNRLDKELSLDERLIVFPNPTNKSIVVKIQNPKPSEAEKSIEIISLEGKSVFQSAMIFNNQGIEFDVSFLPKGLYILKVMTNDEVFIKKLIKE